jgi:hypothetical protein
MRIQKSVDEKQENAYRSGGRGSLVCMKRKNCQQEFGFVNWGGKRRGAGRKPKGECAGVSHAKRARLVARFPVLVTMKLCEGLGTLRTREVNDLIRAAIVAGRREDFRVVEYSLQQVTSTRSSKRTTSARSHAQ